MRRDDGTRSQYIGYRSFRPQLERTKDFADMGIPLRIVFAANTLNSLCGTYCDYPPIWKGPKQYDWSALDAQFEDLLKASPNAQFICEIDLNTPYWAIRKLSVDSFSDITHAACSQKWITMTKEWMLDFIAYAEKKWGARICAYILAGGCTTEWYEWDKGRTSGAKNAAWVRWCRARKLNYGPTVPDLSKIRTAAFENLVYDPAKERHKIDYWRFHNSVITDAILAYASGAHVWASKPCVVFANDRFLAVHTKEGGEIKLSLPRKYAKITDLLEDKVVVENSDSFTCVFAAPDTRLFDLAE